MQDDVAGNMCQALPALQLTLRPGPYTFYSFISHRSSSPKALHIVSLTNLLRNLHTFPFQLSVIIRSQYTTIPVHTYRVDTGPYRRFFIQLNLSTDRVYSLDGTWSISDV